MKTTNINLRKAIGKQVTLHNDCRYHSTVSGKLLSVERYGQVTVEYLHDGKLLIGKFEGRDFETLTIDNT